MAALIPPLMPPLAFSFPPEPFTPLPPPSSSVSPSPSPSALHSVPTSTPPQILLLAMKLSPSHMFLLFSYGLLPAHWYQEINGLKLHKLTPSCSPELPGTTIARVDRATSLASSLASSPPRLKIVRLTSLGLRSSRTRNRLLNVTVKLGHSTPRSPVRPTTRPLIASWQ